MPIQVNLRLISAEALRVTAYKKMKAQLFVASPVSPSLRASVLQKVSGANTQGMGAASTTLAASATAAALADLHSSAWKRVLQCATARVDVDASGASALGLTATVMLQCHDILCIQMVDTGGTSLGWAVLPPEWLFTPACPYSATKWGDPRSTPPPAYLLGVPAPEGSAPSLKLPLAAPPGQAAPTGHLCIGGFITRAPASALKRSSLANTVERSASSIPGGAAAPAGAPPGSPLARIVVLPHWHTKWCDRKRQVCIAAGAVRELNRVGVLVSGVPAGVAPSDVQVRWMRSAGSGTLTDTAAAAAAAAGGSAPPVALHHEDTGLDFTPCAGVPPPGMASSEHWPLGQPRPPLDALAVFDIPPAPPLLQPVVRVAKAQELAAETAAVRSRPGAPRANASMTIQWPAAAMTAHAGLQGAADTLHGATRKGYGVPPPEAVLHDSASAVGFLQAELTEACADPSVYFLRKEDVGCFLIAEVTWPGCDGAVQSQVVGPVDPAPPAAREVWIEGAPEVGQVLTAQAYYAGGVPGACTVEWIVVSEEGDRTTHDAFEVDFNVAASETADCPSASGPHGRLFRVGEEHVGSIFKVSVNPVRIDGVEGAPATSKPSKEVSQASS